MQQVMLCDLELKYIKIKIKLSKTQLMGVVRDAGMELDSAGTG